MLTDEREDGLLKHLGYSNVENKGARRRQRLYIARTYYTEIILQGKIGLGELRNPEIRKLRWSSSYDRTK